jgi:hypothetical protein
LTLLDVWNAIGGIRVNVFLVASDSAP